MNDWNNRNYATKEWRSQFIGVEKAGGENGKGLARTICYVVRVPMWGDRSTAWRKCKKREEAEQAFRDWQDWPKWGGIESFLCDGQVPYRDSSYIRPSRKQKSK